MDRFLKFAINTCIITAFVLLALIVMPTAF